MNNTMQLPESSRRIFLQRSIQALAVLSTAPMIIACDSLNQPFAVEPVIVAAESRSNGPLNDIELNILSAVTDAIIPQNGAFKTGASDVNLALIINQHLAYADQDIVTGLQGSLAFIEHKTTAIFGKPDEQFSQLSTLVRTKILVSMATLDGIPVQIFIALKTLSLFFFYTTKACWNDIGHQGPLIQQQEQKL